MSSSFKENVVPQDTGGLGRQDTSDSAALNQSGASGWGKWQKAVAVTNLASDPEQVYVRLEKLLTGDQGAGGIQISKKAHLFPMLSRAMPVKDGDARGLHLRG